MIRNFARRLCALLLITLSIAILIVSIASVPLAQMTGAGQPSRKHPNVSMSPSLGTANFGSLSGTRPHAKELGVPAMEQGDPIFLPAVTYGTGGDTSSMAVADVNGDGKFDVAVTTYNSHGVGVLLGNGDGTFQPVHIYSPGSTYPSSIAIADLNGDGKPDLVVANEVDPTYFSQEGIVGVLLGNGDGTFQPTLTYSAGGRGASSIAIADVNTDGKPDLLVAIAVYDQVGILLGNGDGTFQPAVTYGADNLWAESVAVADLNGDGRPDLVLAQSARGFSSVGVMLGKGDGTFQSKRSYDSGGVNPHFVAVEDVNGDGRPDVLVANYDSKTVGVLLGNGDGTLQSAVNYGSGGTGATSIAVADVSDDGKPDLLVSNVCGPTNPACLTDARRGGLMGVLLGNGDGTFQPAVTYPSGGFGAVSVASADVNGDGKSDALIANTLFCDNNYCGAGVVGVLLNNIADTTRPVITLSATPSILWPPNGRMVPVTISGSITDTGSGVNASTAAYAVKDEYGEVQPKGAINLGPEGSYSFTVLLQASRLGSDLDGRRYTVIVRAEDNTANRGSKRRAVTVPHDQKH